MQSNSNYHILIQKLDEFIRKFYLNQLIRGVLFTAAILVSAYLLFSFLEYRFYFSTSVRKVLFYSFLGGAGFLLWNNIITPLLKYNHLGKTINHKTAASIIGTHFSEIQDKLLNILELREQAEGTGNQLLIEAGINQKIEKIKPIPFSLAIDLNKNKKYLKYALPPLGVLVFVIFAAPNVLKDSNLRLLKNNTFFEKAAPFNFLVQNKSLEVVQYEDFELKLQITGDILPEQVAIVTATGTYTMQKSDDDAFTYVFNKVPANTDFHFEANGYQSKERTLTVVPKPTLLNFDINVNYPDYTGIKDERLQNTGDLLVPEGTNLEWLFNTENTDVIELFFNDQKMNAVKDGKSSFTSSRKAMQNEVYKIGIGNTQVYNRDTISYTITVIPDEFPQITAEQFKDSTDNKFLYFLGEINDDYGFKSMYFKYKVEGRDAADNYFVKEENKDVLSVPSGVKSNRYTHSFDLRAKTLAPGDRVTYFFEVWDNDGVHGSKSTRTAAMQFVVPTLDELQDIKDEKNEDIKDKLEEVLDDIADVKKQTEKLEDKIFDKKELNWEDKKAIENLMQKNQNIQQSVEEIKEQYKENLELQKEYLEPDPEILEKQEQLEKMFEEVIPEEMKKLMEELQQLMEKMNKEQSLEEMKEMQMNNKQLEQELDRMLELFKQMEMEQKMQETIDKLNQLSEEQQKLAEQTENKQSKQEENIEKQEELNKDFDDVQKDMQEMREMNKELESPKELGNTEQQEQQIDQKMEQSKQQMQQNNKKQAAQEQKSAAQQMKEMAAQMQQQMQQQQQQQQEEDLEALKQLLDNLIKLSVDQESLMKEVKTLKSSNPKFIDLMAQQQKIKEDTKIVEDSLLALAKRVTQISSFITREMSDVNTNLQNSVDQMGERQINQSNLYQQQTMTGYNNLALMLDEVLQQMQQQMAQSMPGSQQCQKPGGKNESQMPSMSEMQKQLNEQLNKMKGQNPQSQQKGGQSGMSKELAEMAQKQAMIREALEKMAKELGGGNTEDGKLAKQLQQLADQMDKTEEDIVNKQISIETLKRQEEILTRLLEAEESERKRKQDNERKSNTANEINRPVPPAIEEYLKKRNAELDLYKTVSPELKPFYKNLVEEYLRSISY
ncbi:MAG: DUF4175 family protein [Chitinophagales bacterium]|nr:DUF4175 family protein [Chitinophagales bacterium]